MAVRKRRKKRNGFAANIIFSIIALFALTVCIVVLFFNYTLNNELSELKKENSELKAYSQTHLYSEDDLDQRVTEAQIVSEEEAKNGILSQIMEDARSGSTYFAVLRNLYPNHVVVPAGKGYEFFPINDEYKKHEYILDNFIEDEVSEEVTYRDGSGNVISQKGIDVSKYNGEIDWDKVKADGIEFAIIRVGFRGSTEGKLVIDETFEDNIKGALDAGIEVGVYFFTQAINESEGREEAEFVLDAIRDYNVTFPVVLDVETYENGRADDIEASARTDAAIAFLDRVKEGGYTPMLYGNLKGYMIMLEMGRLEGYDKWFAYYACPVYFPYEFAIWQYSEDGSVNGIKGDCDLNICLKRY